MTELLRQTSRKESLSRNHTIPVDPISDVGLRIDDMCLRFHKLRKNPLLIMYYPDDMGQMTDEDMATLHDEFRRRGFSHTHRMPNLDVIFHTLGGKADTGYMLAQILRSFSNSINFLIPYHAASAGTLTCFSGDKISFGAYAYLSPIDVSLGDFPLMSIDYFMNFAVECRTKMQNAFKKHADRKSEFYSRIRSLDRNGKTDICHKGRNFLSSKNADSVLCSFIVIDLYVQK